MSNNPAKTDANKALITSIWKLWSVIEIYFGMSCNFRLTMYLFCTRIFSLSCHTCSCWTVNCYRLL